MRIGLIGVSSPLFYDWSGRAYIDEAPNPILDSPFGLMLLYDELWFLTKDLCPRNLRGVSFVRILDEETALPDLSGLDYGELTHGYRDELRAMYEGFRPSSASFQELVASMRMGWDARPDNHGRGLDLGGVATTGRAGTPENILFDLAVIERLGRKGVELVGNTVGQSAMETLEPSIRGADLAHVMVIDGIPNYLGPDGPYHPVIDEVREDRYLKDFRKWISKTATTSQVDAQTMKADVEKRIQEAQEEVFLKYLDPRRKYETIGKTVTTAIASLFVPGVGEAASTIAELRADRRVRDQRYQGFLVHFRRAAREQGGSL
jgi:hypothetical protein